VHESSPDASGRGRSIHAARLRRGIDRHQKCISRISSSAVALRPTPTHCHRRRNRQVLSGTRDHQRCTRGQRPPLQSLATHGRFRYPKRETAPTILMGNVVSATGLQWERVDSSRETNGRTGNIPLIADDCRCRVFLQTRECTMDSVITTRILDQNTAERDAEQRTNTSRAFARLVYRVRMSMSP
jgi:hypothetical protein